MRGGLKYKPDARVTLLLINPSDFTNRQLIRFKTFTQVSSSLSMHGIGTATVVFANKNWSFFKGIQRPQWMSEASAEVDLLHFIWEKFRDENTSSNVNLPGKYAETFFPDKVLLPWINPFDCLWIDYCGRDGVWYSGFSGIVTGYKENVRAGQTPTFTITAKDFRRILQTLPVVVGLNNMAKLPDLETILTGTQVLAQDTTPIIQNRMSTYNSPGAIIDDVLKTVNGLLGLESSTYAKFWTKPVFPDSFSAYTYKTSDDEFNVWNPILIADDNSRRSLNPAAAAYYDPSTSAPICPHAYNDKLFDISQSSVYQFLLRSQLNMLAIDTETAMGIFNRIAQVVMSFFYVDQAGNLRYEYPRYATVPSSDPDPMAPGLKAGAPDPETPWHSLNYWISAGDFSFISYQGGEDESERVATRVVAVQDYAYLSGALTELVKASLYNGYAVVEPNDLLRYGLREVNLSTFYMRTQISKDVMNKYAKAALYHLNSASRSFSIVLNQRPDTMLNRCLVFSERSRVGLITDISDSFSPQSGHQRTHTCRFVRYLGEKIEYPWVAILDASVNSMPGEKQVR